MSNVQQLAATLRSSELARLRALTRPPQLRPKPEAAVLVRCVLLRASVTFARLQKTTNVIIDRGLWVWIYDYAMFTHPYDRPPNLHAWWGELGERVAGPEGWESPRASNVETMTRVLTYHDSGPGLRLSI